MRLLMTALLAAAAMAPPPAAGCEPASVQPSPVRLAGDAGRDAALLFLPPGWQPGDPAAVIGGDAPFRLGCDHPGMAALLEAGAAVLALAAPEERPAERLAGAFAILRDGFGAGRLAVLWPERPVLRGAALAAAPLCGAALGGLGLDGEASARACALGRSR